MYRGGSRARERAERSSRQVRYEVGPENGTGRWPEVRIVRQVMYDAVGAEAVRGFVDNLGSRNLGSGEAKALGSMALTIVDAQAMGRMLAKKYRKAFGTRKGALNTLRSFEKDYNQFVGRDEQQRLEAVQAEADAKRLIDPTKCTVVMPVQSGDKGFCVAPQSLRSQLDVPAVDEIFLMDDEDWDLDPDSEEMPAIYGQPNARRWNSGDFSVRDRLKPYGDDVLGFDLSGVDQLYEEFDATEEYLRRGLGLDTNLMLPVRNEDFRFEPHVGIFRSYAPARFTHLSYIADFPASIPLDQPRAQVNRGQVSGQ